MMQNYELMLLLNPNAMDEVDDFLKGLEDIIKGDKGDLVEKKLLGKRQLAYPINNMNYANYVHLDIKVNSETLTTLEEKFRYDQNVFRHLTVKIAK
ncbi:MAG: 30S ribosomal protein S6 [SAR86 cluster bacterium]|mgnify:FL=1|jgi:small subunit ribosomal protein S6|nr:30S ribosomal protein S6 [Gammaproteobacteria bacterium]MBL6683358.1 30S ribosomal protein S6 [SAR86 cluster bacterium]MEC7166970.1 30S ribosomal protein S6 [Pseudomonadota bacterium]MEC7513453.1 30S ribosomal protein S6 [Pseudomonadota bacterium]MEC7804940.1 30S ribosomal protein S6 [Pseudomonadota bacterium]|tara:strand:- start:67 stop:354 length:288 start_codon:yes stop_codon:yes gene_type:complete